MSEPILPAADALSLTVSPSEWADFQIALQVIKAYPRRPEDAAASGQSPSGTVSSPGSSLSRILKVTGWILYAFLVLFLNAMFRAMHQPVLAWSVLLLGPVLPIYRILRWRRRKADQPTCSETVSTAAEVVAAQPAQPDSFATLTAADLPLRPESPAVSAAPASRRRRIVGFLVTLLVWIAIACSALPDLTTVWLVCTIFLHEAGHFTAMYLLGYSQMSMFFIPFVAGAVMGQKADETVSDRLIMLLCGPAPGLLLGCLIYWLQAWQPMAAFRSVAIWLVAINLLNLLPVWPLDGGRICWILFARSSVLAQTLLSACSFVGAIFLMFSPQGGVTFLAVTGFLLIWWLPGRYRQASACLQFVQQYPRPPGQIQLLSAAQLLSLFRLTSATEAAEQRGQRMLQIYNRVALLPETGAQLRYLVAYLVLWLTTLITAAGTGMQTDARAASVALGTLLDAVMR